MFIYCQITMQGVKRLHKNMTITRSNRGKSFFSFSSLQTFHGHTVYHGIQTQKQFYIPLQNNNLVNKLFKYSYMSTATGQSQLVYATYFIILDKLQVISSNTMRTLNWEPMLI